MIAWLRCISVVTLCAGITGGHLIPFDTEQVFDLKNVVELRDFSEDAHKISYVTSGQLTVRSVWNLNEKQLLSFELSSLSLKPSKNNNFGSKEFSSLEEKPFYVLFIANIPRTFYSDTTSNISQRNLQKGIASLFYLSYRDDTTVEEDVLGNCTAVYKRFSSKKIKKTKSNCNKWSHVLHRRLEKVLDVAKESYHEIDYGLSEEGGLETVSSFERHTFRVAMTEHLGSWVDALTTIRHMKSHKLDKGLYDITPDKLASEIKGSNLVAESERNSPSQKGASLKEFLNPFREKLINQELGNKDDSGIFIELLPAFRRASKKQLKQLFISSENKDIINTLLDLLGAVQSEAGYDAVMSVYDFENGENFDRLEKYLQCLAIGTRPNKYIIESLFQKVIGGEIPDERLKETALLSVCSMVRQLKQFFPEEDQVYAEVKTHVLNSLDNCRDSRCKSTYIRCLQNLLDSSTISKLLSIALTDTPNPSVAAMKALRAFDINIFLERNRKDFEKIFYQHGRKFDSSARTLSLDILLDMGPSEEQLRELLEILPRKGESSEIKTYFLQKLKILSDRCPKFSNKLRRVLSGRKHIFNYDVFAPNGLTTVLERMFSTSALFNGSLISTQEVHRGILKRGLVEMEISSGNEAARIFSLALYTCGLWSIIGSDSEDGNLNEDDLSDETAVTAGMEITVLGSRMRPLVFFTGNAELMSHAWSGTASEPTSAYQSTLLIHDHEAYVVLHNGFSIHLELSSANSVDLFGNVELSLWNRNARTKIHKNSGWTVSGTTSILNPFKEFKHAFSATTSPNIALVADVDFYSTLKLCIQLDRVEDNVKVSSNLSSISADNKELIENSTNSEWKSPGFTMALNQKNNEMCNILLE